MRDSCVSIGRIPDIAGPTKRASGHFELLAIRMADNDIYEVVPVNHSRELEYTAPPSETLSHPPMMAYRSVLDERRSGLLLLNARCAEGPLAVSFADDWMRARATTHPPYFRRGAVGPLPSTTKAARPAQEPAQNA